MSDRLLDKLRNPDVMSMHLSAGSLYESLTCHMSQAADEIERLRKENARFREALEDIAVGIGDEPDAGMTARGVLRHAKT